MSQEIEACNPSGYSKGKGKGKGGPPPPPAPAGGPPKSNAPALAFKVKTVERRQDKSERLTRLHMTAAQQLVSAQELDGHFDAKALAMKLDRLWGKLMVLDQPSNPKDDLSANVLDATVFVTLLLERFVDKSGCCDEAKRDEVITWFGRGSLLENRWFHEATSWLTAQQPCWREERSNFVDAIIDKWFATDSECKLPEIDQNQLQAKQAEMSAKFASSQIESLRREKLWADNKPITDIDAISWQDATAIRWCFGGSGGCFLVRIGNGKLLVKGCHDEGDVLAHEFAKIVRIRVADLRFVSPSSDDFELISRALTAAQPDEPEHGRNLLVQLTKLRKTGCPLMIMEFVVGDSLLGRLGSDAISRGEETFMHELGRVLAMDAFVNNWDRMPAVHTWPSSGNLGNVLVAEGGDMVAIDQAVQLLCDPRVRAEYYQAIRSFVEDTSRETRLESEPLKRVKNAIQGQVMKWTGDVERDAKTFEQFMIKPDSAQGVVLDDIAGGFLLDGAREVFSKAAALRVQFLASKKVVADTIKSYFVNVEGEHHAERIDAGMDFIEECMAVVESEDQCWKQVQATLENNMVFPGRKFFSTLQCKPNINQC